LWIKQGVIPRALERVAELASNAVSNIPARVAVMHANSYEEALKFAESLKRRVNIEQLTIGDVGASLALHGGPGMIGVVLLALR
jgi:fatty acid-binding protein DegV